MKKAFFILTAALAIAACGNQPQKKAVEATFIGEETTVDGFALKVDGDTIQYTEVVKPQVDLAAFPVDEEGYIVIFDGSSLAGWRLDAVWNLRSGRFDANGEMPDWNTLDLSLSKDFRLGRVGVLGLNVTVRDLLDCRYELVRDYPMPGRSVLGGFTFKF